MFPWGTLLPLLFVYCLSNLLGLNQNDCSVVILIKVPINKREPIRVRLMIAMYFIIIIIDKLLQITVFKLNVLYKLFVLYQSLQNAIYQCIIYYFFTIEMLFCTNFLNIFY